MEENVKVSPRVAMMMAVLSVVEKYVGSDHAMFKEVKELMEPKRAGVADLEEVIKRREDGSIYAIQCSVSGVWLPATDTYFNVKPTATIGFDRNSKMANAIVAAHKKSIQATKDNALRDFLAQHITAEELANIVAGAEASTPDYSTVVCKEEDLHLLNG